MSGEYFESFVLNRLIFNNLIFGIFLELKIFDYLLNLLNFFVL